MKKHPPTVAPPTIGPEEEVFVEGGTAAEFVAIVKEVLNRWIISLAKRLARADFEAALAPKKKHRKRVLTPDGETGRQRGGGDNVGNQEGS